MEEEKNVTYNTCCEVSEKEVAKNKILKEVDKLINSLFDFSDKSHKTATLEIAAVLWGENKVVINRHIKQEL